MYTYAVINTNNIIENIISWDGVTEYAVPNGFQLVQITDDIKHHTDTRHAVTLGDSYIDGKFVARTPVVINAQPIVTQPTLEELQAQLLTITQQLAALANTANT
jgi:hypothetical protein